MEWKPCTNLKAVNIQYNAERHFVSATLLRSSNSWYLELSHEKDFYFSRLGTNMARMTWSYGRGPERFCWRYGYCDFLVMVGTKGLISSGKVNSAKLQTILIGKVLKGFIGGKVQVFSSKGWYKRCYLSSGKVLTKRSIQLNCKLFSYILIVMVDEYICL